MRPSIAAVVPAALLVAAFVSFTGCNRASDESPQQPAADAAPSAPAAVEPAAPEATATADAAAPPEGVLQAYVWHCDGDLTLKMKNLLRENAITLEMHEGARKLPQVVSASGAKYSDGSLTFWTKGDTAVFEREGGAPVHCRQDRYQSLLADARARGVSYRGTGNEPGWTVEIGPGTRLSFVTNYGQERHEFDTSKPGGDGRPGLEEYQAERDGERLKVTIAKEPCADDMSGQPFDHRMIVEYAGQTLRGCATDLR